MRYICLDEESNGFLHKCYVENVLKLNNRMNVRVEVNSKTFVGQFKFMLVNRMDWDAEKRERDG